MPKQLPVGATDDEVLAAVREWAALLAAERYDEAYDFLAHAPGEHWTPALLRAVVENYGSPAPRRDGRRVQVTPIETAGGGPAPRHEVDREAVSPDEVASVWFDLPLNGEWSDLTALLSVRADGDALVLRLDDLHVM
jgi:hypothetical protein